MLHENNCRYNLTGDGLNLSCVVKIPDAWGQYNFGLLRNTSTKWWGGKILDKYWLRNTIKIRKLFSLRTFTKSADFIMLFEFIFFNLTYFKIHRPLHIYNHANLPTLQVFIQFINRVGTKVSAWQHFLKYRFFLLFLYKQWFIESYPLPKKIKTQIPNT